MGYSRIGNSAKRREVEQLLDHREEHFRKFVESFAHQAALGMAGKGVSAASVDRLEAGETSVAT